MNRIREVTETIRVVRSAKCFSVSRKSSLGYDVGLSPEGDVYFRVTSNSAPGAFSRAWVSWKDIQKAIEGPAREKAITSAHLARLCGGGQNTSGFLLAVLNHEGLLKASTAKKRCHELVDDAAFLASVKTWDQAGKGLASNAGAKPHPKAGSKAASATKYEPSMSAEGALPTDEDSPPLADENGDRPSTSRAPSVTTTANAGKSSPKQGAPKAVKGAPPKERGKRR